MAEMRGAWEGVVSEGRARPTVDLGREHGAARDDSETGGQRLRGARGGEATQRGSVNDPEEAAGIPRVVAVGSGQGTAQTAHRPRSEHEADVGARDMGAVAGALWPAGLCVLLRDTHSSQRARSPGFRGKRRLWVRARTVPASSCASGDACDLERTLKATENSNCPLGTDVLS